MGDAKCLECHTAIADLVSVSRGYHSSAKVKNRKCLECHNDHHGREFQMVRFNPVGFDHALTSYRLEGKHGKLSCAQCHKATHIRDRKLRQKSWTYFGLAPRCLGCHSNYHRSSGDGRDDCLKCHSFDTFSIE